MMFTKLQSLLKYISATMIAISLLMPTAIFAVDPPPPGPEPSACAGAHAVGATCKDDGLKTSLAGIFDTLFYIIGAIAVLIIILGGIYYITSTGDASRIKRAKDTILYAVIGLALAILARTIVGFVIGNLA